MSFRAIGTHVVDGDLVVAKELVRPTDAMVSNALMISAENGQVRIRVDGAVPTLAAGFPVPQSEPGVISLHRKTTVWVVGEAGAIVNYQWGIDE